MHENYMSMNLYVHNNTTLKFVKNFKHKKANPF